MKKSTLFHRLFKRWHFFVAMFILWMLYNYQFDVYTVVLGLIVSALMTFFTSFVLYDDTHFRSHMLSPWRILVYLAVLMKEIFTSAWTYMGIVLHGQYDILVFDLPLSIDDPIKIALVANSITLTPGTVSMDVNQNVITVLAIVKKGTTVEQVSRPILHQFERLLKAS